MRRQFQYLSFAQPVQTIARTVLTPVQMVLDMVPPTRGTLPTALMMAAASFVVPVQTAAVPVSVLGTQVMPPAYSRAPRHVTVQSYNVKPPATITPVVQPDIHRIPVEEHFAWQRPVIRFEGSPPAGATKGDRYIVSTTAFANWVGHENDIAWFYETDWKYDTPTEGWYAFDLDTGLLYVFDGTAWTTNGASAGWAPMSDGLEPPTIISNGAGQFVMVPYLP